MVQYPAGDRIRLGDTLLLEGGVHGIVVGIIDEGTYAAAYVPAEWAYLGTGLLVEADDAGLTNYEAPRDAWALISRE